MKVLVAIEYHFVKGPNGAYYAECNYGYEFWQQYLKIFDEVLVLGRTKTVDTINPEWKRADGQGVSFSPLADFRGPWQYLRNRSLVKSQVTWAVKQVDFCILMVPGLIGTLSEKVSKKLGKPFAVEVLGDPWDSLSPGTVRSITRPFVRRIFTRHLRRQCQQAFAASYVTAQALQKRYPIGINTFTMSSSDVAISDEALADKPRDFTVDSPQKPSVQTDFQNRLWKLIFVGSLETFYKGQDVLLKAFQICLQKGLKASLTIVGDGRSRGKLEKMSVELGIDAFIHFAGKLPGGTPVREQLRKSDLFILPSRQEGLPRAMVEAMAMALPCIGSEVGGIPELLAPDDIVQSRDPQSLANKIIEVLSNPERLTKMSQRNLNTAKGYRSEVLRKNRLEFYRIVREKAENFQ